MAQISLLKKVVEVIVLYVVPLAVVAFAGLMTALVAFAYPHANAVDLVEGGAESAQWGPWQEGNLNDLHLLASPMSIGLRKADFDGPKDSSLPSAQDRYCARVGTITTFWHVMPVRHVRYWADSGRICVEVYPTGRFQFRRGPMRRDISIVALVLFGGWFLWVLLLKKFIFKKAPAPEPADTSPQV